MRGGASLQNSCIDELSSMEHIVLFSSRTAHQTFSKTKGRGGGVTATPGPHLATTLMCTF